MSDNDTAAINEVTAAAEALISELIAGAESDITALANTTLDSFLSNIKAHLNDEIANTSSLAVKIRDRGWLLFVAAGESLVKTIGVPVLITAMEELVKIIINKIKDND